MKSRKWIFWALLAGMFLYEGYALLTPAHGDTISEIVWDITKVAVVIVFFFGVLCGHFFWPKECNRSHED